MTAHASLPEEVPVLVCGAGPVGLATSILLSRQGIRHLVVEKREAVSQLPRARGITVRSAEILTQLGLDDEVAAFSLPPLWTQCFVYTETVAGALVGVMRSATRPGSHAAVSPCDYRVAAQDRIDPMLYRAATAYREADIRFRTSVTGFEQASEPVVVTLPRADGSSARVRCRYLVAADGGRSPLRQMAGIGEQGRANLRSFVNCHVRADLSRFTAGREGTLIWTLAPGREGLFQPLDGEQAWAIQIQFDPQQDPPESWTQDRVLARLREMVGGADAGRVEFEIARTYTYTLSMMLSDRLRQGRLLLVGDAAHQVPPYGGFGLNTGLQTAHNLVWKLGAVLRGEATAALLDTFDSERREVASRVMAFGRTNAGYIDQLMAAVRAAGSAEERRRLIEGSAQYGNWVGLDLGVHYEGPGAYVPDDVAPPATPDPVQNYVPHAKPGQRAPHLWVQHGDRRVSTVMLFDGRFVLLAGPQVQAWVDAAAAHGRPSISAYRVANDGDLVPEGDFCGLYRIEASGAVLVRPDGHVAFRAPSLTSDAVLTLNAVMEQVLRPS